MRRNWKCNPQYIWNIQLYIPSVLWVAFSIPSVLLLLANHLVRMVIFAMHTGQSFWSIACNNWSTIFTKCSRALSFIKINYWLSTPACGGTMDYTIIVVHFLFQKTITYKVKTRTTIIVLWLFVNKLSDPTINLDSSSKTT
jgi:hypothetical protein